MKFTEPRWITRLDQAFWPIIYILSILTLSLLDERLQAQDMVTIEKWRLEKACKELILLDSLTKDYASKDSLLQEYRSVVSDLKSELGNWKHVAAERLIQVDLMQQSQDTFVRERDVWKIAYDKERKKRFSISAGLSYQPFNKHSFGPSVNIGWSIYKF